MKKLALALLALPVTAVAQTSIRADSTICVAFRITTRPTGAIYTTSVNKVACGGKRDTIQIVRVDTLPGRVDTVKVAGPATHTYWYPVPINGTVHYGIRQNVGSKPESFLLPTANRVDTITVVAYYKPNVIGGTVYYSLAAYDGIQPPPYVLPAARVDTVTIVRVDTVRLPPIIITAPAPPSSGVVELPRLTVDTRMPLMPMSGDTLYECTPLGCKCKGPTCAEQKSTGRLILP